MKKDRIRWLFAIGLLGLLGFSSCSPRLRPRRTASRDLDSIRVVPLPAPDTGTRLRPLPFPGDMPPAKLMYGVPPARFEKMEAPEKQLKTE